MTEFGEVRALMQREERGETWRAEVRDVLQAAHEQDPAAYLSTWVPYLSGFDVWGDHPLVVTTLSEEAWAWRKRAPFARIVQNPMPEWFEELGEWADALTEKLGGFGGDDILRDFDIVEILYLPGDVWVEGDLDAGWAKKQAAFLGEDVIPMTVVIDGDVIVHGDARPINEFNLFIAGDLRARSLWTGGTSCAAIGGDVHLETSMYMHYNDMATSVNGALHVPYVVNSDHSTNVDRHPSYIYLTPRFILASALEAITLPEVWKENRFDTYHFLGLAQEGQDPFTLDVLAARAALLKIESGVAQEMSVGVDALIELGAAAFVEFDAHEQGYGALHRLILGVEASRGQVSTDRAAAWATRLLTHGARADLGAQCYGSPNKPTAQAMAQERGYTWLDDV